MTQRCAMAVFVVLLILPAASFAQSVVGDIAATAPSDSASGDSSVVRPAVSLLFLPECNYQTSTTLTFSMHPQEITNRLYGFEYYRASRLECSYRGAGAGMTLGMAVGAFGMMTGAWDERETWYLAGAMTALGMLYGGFVKADDPKWNLRIRWEPER